jgi:hypothetical protein
MTARTTSIARSAVTASHARPPAVTTAAAAAGAMASRHAGIRPRSAVKRVKPRDLACVRVMDHLPIRKAWPITI